MGRGMEHFKAEGAQLKNKSTVIPFVPPVSKPCPHCGGTGKVLLGYPYVPGREETILSLHKFHGD